MGEFVNKKWVTLTAWLIAAIIVGLNIKLVYQEVIGWIQEAGDNSWLVVITVVPLCFAALALLVYITIKPFIDKRRVEKESKVPHGVATHLDIHEVIAYKRIAICIDFSNMDSMTIERALAQGGKNANYLLMHVVETAGALVYGSEIRDMESDKDTRALKDYAMQLKNKGYAVDFQVGFGNPRNTIPNLVKSFDADLLVMGGHGHKFFKDLILGATVDAVRHKVGIPVLIVQNR